MIVQNTFFFFLNFPMVYLFFQGFCDINDFDVNLSFIFYMFLDVNYCHIYLTSYQHQMPIRAYCELYVGENIIIWEI